MELPVQAEVKEGVNPGTLQHPLADGRKGEDLFPDPSHPLAEFLRRHLQRLKDHVEGIVLFPVPGEDSSFFFQPIEGLRPGVRGHDKGEGPVEPMFDGEIDDALKDPGVIVIETYDKGPHDSDAMVMNPLDRFSVPRGPIESLPHHFKVLLGKRLEADIECNAAALCESLEKFRVKSNRDGGVTVPEKVEALKNGNELKAEAPVPGHIRIDDVEKPPLEKIGKIFIESGEELFCDGRKHRAFEKEVSQFSLDLFNRPMAVAKTEKL
jgi:hypothetical protein